MIPFYALKNSENLAKSRLAACFCLASCNYEDIYGNAISETKKMQTRAASSAVNAINGNGIYGNAWNEGNCEYCKEPFKKKTTW